MIYIDNVDTSTIRIGDEPAGAGVSKAYPNVYLARKDEKELIWLWHNHNDESILNNRTVDLITYNGTVYGTAEEFVAAYNANVTL